MNLPEESVMNYFVYVLSAKDSRAMYVGLTDDLMKGIYENKSEFEKNSGKKSKKLLHYEIFDDLQKAQSRRKQLEKSLTKNRTN